MSLTPKDDVASRRSVPAADRNLASLLALGVISYDDLPTSGESGRDAMARLLALGVITATDSARATAHSLALPYISLPEMAIAADLVASFPERLLRRHVAVPLGLDDERLRVAMRDPSDLYALEDLRVASGRELSPVVATEADIVSVLDSVYSEEARITRESSGEAVEIARDVLVESGPEAPPVVRLFDSLLKRAVAERASDIHLEPLSGRLSVRFRIDGVLREVMEVPPGLRNGFVTRVKVLANLDIAERRIPQDGRFTAEHPTGRLDLRVASLPTVHGEGLVLRLLDPTNLVLDLSKLGLSDSALATYRRVFRRPYGSTLVTGPTGSGKSTTLYAALVEINSPEKKVVTIEDPVEYRIGGLTQIQVNLRAGLTFATGLRSVLRADPDVVMIGEIRDFETARASVEAALTGHLVLATLHTADAPSALTRLTEMGVEPYLSASAIDCIIAQRLARRLCDSCKVPTHISDADLKEMDFPFAHALDQPTFYEPSGCRECDMTGYRGRVGVFELMEMTDEIRSLILSRSSSSEVSSVASRDMVRLKEDGLLKAASGLTSIEEILRTVV